MKKLMLVVLRVEYRSDSFIDDLNKELEREYWGSDRIKFNPWSYVQEEARFMNYHPHAKAVFPDVPVPYLPNK